MTTIITCDGERYHYSCPPEKAKVQFLECYTGYLAQDIWAVLLSF